jgi:hypothetical protein
LLVLLGEGIPAKYPGRATKLRKFPGTTALAVRTAV